MSYSMPVSVLLSIIVMVRGGCGGAGVKGVEGVMRDGGVEGVMRDGGCIVSLQYTCPNQ